MIAFFPKLYQNELLYSILARYHARSGYARYVSTAEDIYQSGKITHPSIEFVNKYTSDVMSWLTKEAPWEAIAEKHTMYPAYIRFLPLTRRQQAVEGVRNCNGNWKNLMCLPNLNEKRYLRYCPECAKEDREKYGETYWHREHQIPRIRICPKHKTHLENSTIPIASKSTPGLFDAQSNVPEINITRQCENEREIEFTRYVLEVFDSPIDLKTDFNIGTYLQSQISPEYKNKSGFRTDISKFYADYISFYNGIPTMPQSYMQKIFNGYIFDTYFVLQLAFFEGVSVSQITNIPTTTNTTNLGGLYSHLSEKYNVEYSVVENIATEILNHTQHRISNISGPQRIEYDKVDTDLLPKVKSFVDKMANGQGRPERITVTKIQRLMGLPQKCFKKLPQCKAYIVSRTESQIEYWARQVEWAVKEIDSNNKLLSLSKIMKLTHMRKSDIISCSPFINDSEIKDTISELLKIQT